MLLYAETLLSGQPLFYKRSLAKGKVFRVGGKLEYDFKKCLKFQNNCTGIKVFDATVLVAISHLP